MLVWLADWTRPSQGSSGQEEVSEETAGEREAGDESRAESGESGCQKEETELAGYNEGSGSEYFYCIYKRNLKKVHLNALV